MRESAAGLVRQRREPYALFLKALARDDHVPALFHCSAGKDRAGGMSALVQLLLGVNRDDIMADYLLSRKAGKEVKAEWLQAAGIGNP